MATITEQDADRAVKAKHPALVAACGISAGQRVLDVGAGSGNAADPERVAALDRAFLALLTDWNRPDTEGRARYESEYLLVTARKELDR